MRIGRIRQKLWAVSVFLTCAFAIFLWSSDSVSNTYSYRVNRNSDGNSIIADNQTHDLQDAYYDNKDDNDSVDRKLIKLNYAIIANSSGDLKSTRTNFTSHDASQLLFHGNKSISRPVHDDTSRSTTKLRKKTRPKPKKRKLSSNSTSNVVPPFHWCYKNESLDLEMSEELPCDLLFQGGDGNNSEIYHEAKEESKRWRPPCDYSDEEMFQLASNQCKLFRRSFNFLDDGVGVPVSQEELDFPLAYVMVVERWAAQVVRILSSVYRPHNLYCLTYDRHANSVFKKAMKAVAKCLNTNIIMPEKHLEIYWADISLLNATLNCMRLMSKRDHNWRYVQILSYNDFPLRTNKEMVEILRIFDGANDVELTQSQPERYTHYYKYAELDNNRFNETRPIPPNNLVIYKGSFAATLSREFIRFALENEQAQEFFEWSIPTWAAEEQFWATLIHNEHIKAPGHFPGQCLDYYSHGSIQKLWVSRFQVWYHGCEGRYRSGSCIFGVGDLPMLKKRPELIAHKFYVDFEPATFYCLARRHYERTYLEESEWEFENEPLNTKYYAALPAVQYQRMKNKKKFNCAIIFKKMRR